MASARFLYLLAAVIAVFTAAEGRSLRDTDAASNSTSSDDVLAQDGKQLLAAIKDNWDANVDATKKGFEIAKEAAGKIFQNSSDALNVLGDAWQKGAANAKNQAAINKANDKKAQEALASIAQEVLKRIDADVKKFFNLFG